MVRVAVIGAGPSGLSQLRAFQTAAQKGAKIPEIVCYEKSENWGGLWKYTWRTGLEENGEPVHGSMYHNLWTNSPKECVEFADYTFDEHFGKPIASYLPRHVMFDYIEGCAKKADVRKWIRFHTAVRRVTYDEDTGMFSVTAQDLISDEERTKKFDYVVVATGHFSTPNAPHFDGLDAFNGRVLHAHDFRDAHEFKDKDVLVVGSSYSAEDIALMCWKYGSKSITISHLKESMGYKWPDTIREAPLLQKVAKNTCTFKDGSTVDVDAIVLCTGYLHYFPFMAKELKLVTADRYTSPFNLYKGVVFVDNPKLFYLGMQHQFYTFTMFDAQTWYVRDIILGRLRVPDRDARAADVQVRVSREDADATPLAIVRNQGDYVKELMADTDYPDFDVDATKESFLHCLKHRQEDIVGFRDNSYKSAITGTVSAVLPLLWKDNFDDSFASLVGK